MTNIKRQFGSRSQPGVTHTTELRDDGEKSCTCKGFAHRKTCFHVETLLKEVIDNKSL